MTIFCFEVLSGRRAEHPELWGIDESWQRAWRVDPVSLDPELAPWDSLLVDEDNPEEMPGDFASYDVHLLGADEGRFYGAYEWTRESGYEDLFFAFDRRGRVVWSVAGDGASSRTANSIIAEDGRVFVSHPGVVAAYDAKTGELEWATEVETTLASITEDGQFLWGVNAGVVSRLAASSGEVFLQEDLSSVGARFVVEFGGTVIVGADEELRGYSLPAMNHEWSTRYGTPLGWAPLVVEARWSFAEGAVYVLAWDYRIDGQISRVLRVNTAGELAWARFVSDAFIQAEPPFIVDLGIATVLVVSNGEMSRLSRVSESGDVFSRDLPGRARAAPPWGNDYLFVMADQSLYRVDGSGSFHAPWNELQEAKENWMGSIWGDMTFEVESAEVAAERSDGALIRSVARFR